jgi:hypothetical protein
MMNVEMMNARNTSSPTSLDGIYIHHLSFTIILGCSKHSLFAGPMKPMHPVPL